MEVKAPRPQIPAPGWEEVPDLQEWVKHRVERPDGDRASAAFEGPVSPKATMPPDNNGPTRRSKVIVMILPPLLS